MPIVTLLVTCLAVASGWVCTYLIWPGRTTRAKGRKNAAEPEPTTQPGVGPGAGTRLAQGLVLGYTALGLVAYPVVAWLGYHDYSYTLVGAMVASPLALLRRAGIRRALVADLRDAPGLVRQVVWLLPTALILGWLFWRAAYASQGGLFTGYDNNLGDLPFHLGIVSGFAWGGNFPPQHPEYAGIRLTYPFMIDFLVAFWWRGGFSLLGAIWGQNLTLGLALVVLLYRFAVDLTGRALAAHLVPVLTFLSGGLGFVQAFRDWLGGPLSIWQYLLHLPHDYTITPDGTYRWGNAVTTLLVPQRALLLGLPLALMIWSLWWQALNQEAPERRLWVAAGVLTGVLPLTHAHTFLTVMMLAAWMFLLFPRLVWVLYGAVTMALASPAMLWAMHGASTHATSFFAVQIGWDHGQQNPVLFWLRNAGLFLPLWAAGCLLAESQKPRLLRFHLPFAGLFVISNLFRLSPWIWDNVKYLFIWYIGSAVLAAWALDALLTYRIKVVRAVGVLALLGTTAAGALDVWRVASCQTSFQEFDPAGLAVAQALMTQTPPEARVMSDPTYNPPALLSGRRSIMGYGGHLWSQGLDYAERERQLREMYAGGPGALDLMRQLQVSYVVVGPQERHDLVVNEAFLQRFRVVLQSGDYRVYQVQF